LFGKSRSAPARAEDAPQGYNGSLRDPDNDQVGGAMLQFASESSDSLGSSAAYKLHFELVQYRGYHSKCGGEMGKEEYVAYAEINGCQTGCITGSAGSDYVKSLYGYCRRTQSMSMNSVLSVALRAWEDDEGSRCTYQRGDDCYTSLSDRIELSRLPHNSWRSRTLGSSPYGHMLTYKYYIEVLTPEPTAAPTEIPTPEPTDPSCDVLPISPSGEGLPEGCPGAVDSLGNPSRAVCADGIWWSGCCYWDGDCKPLSQAETCKTSGPELWGLADLRLDAGTLVHNNLGGKGPDSGAAEIRYRRAIDVVMHGQVLSADLVLTAVSPYTPGENVPGAIGTGVHGQVGSISIRGKTSVKVNFAVVYPDTDEQIVVRNLWVSFLDIAGDVDDASVKEHVFVNDVYYWKVPAKSKVKALEKKSGKIRFTSKKTKGRGVFVAPTNALDMTSSQLKNAVAVQYDNVSSFVVEFSAKGREENETRSFLFAGRCAINFDEDGCPYQSEGQ